MPASTALPPSRRPLRRLAGALAVVALAKLAALLLIWWAAAPPSRPDTRPDAVARHLAPASPATDKDPP